MKQTPKVVPSAASFRAKEARNDPENSVVCGQSTTLAEASQLIVGASWS